MNTWLENKWDALRTNFWFLPGVMAVLAVAVCLAFLQIDRAIGDRFPLLSAGSVEGVRTLLGVLIGAMVTAVSIVFSTTVVVLTLAASQLGPRLLRTYVRDRSNQALIGVFIATLFYSLTAMFVVGRMAPAGNLPNLTVLGAFALTCASLIVLIYFIHHVAQSIQAPNVILAVSAELNELIDRTYTETLPDGAAEPLDKNVEERLPEHPVSVPAKSSGYLQAIDTDGLMRLADEQDMVVRTLHRPGHFVMEKDVLADIYSSEEVEEAVLERVRQMFSWKTEQKLQVAAHRGIQSKFIMGYRRTPTQDVEFVMMELVEIALRALSPGINDPFTAMTCIDRLAEALRRLARRSIPPAYRYEQGGRLRLIVDHTSFEGLCNAAFHQIRQHAASNAAVLIRLLEDLRLVILETRTEEQKSVVWRHACMVRRAAERLPEPEDRKDVDERFRRLARDAGYPEEFPEAGPNDDRGAENGRED